MSMVPSRGGATRTTVSMSTRAWRGGHYPQEEGLYAIPSIHDQEALRPSGGHAGEEIGVIALAEGGACKFLHRGQVIWVERSEVHWRVNVPSSQ